MPTFPEDNVELLREYIPQDFDKVVDNLRPLKMVLIALQYRHRILHPPLA